MPPAARASGFVLLVEDEAPVRRLAAMMLAELGREVVEAADGHQALEVFRHRGDEVALVLLDLTMPGMSGEELLSELERAGCRAPIVLCSGSDPGDLMERLAGGIVAGFLQKPYRFADLERVVAAGGPETP